MTSIVFALDKLTQERDSAIATLDRLKQLSSAEKEKLNDIVEKEYIMKFRAVLKQVAHYEKGILRAEAAGEQCPQAPAFRIPSEADPAAGFVLTDSYPACK
ncbi:hypothetical protein B484DRAFT_399797 [Ochromonadaceae sp. CCMP2298]|nr:hypothetical protein B484DRAFT_399797 [Ochromonadaceae sp. CCMP2298]|mmetsp:Transcript_33066/g.72836  ORF Transcript_33066/g.72836 Transcript_33066/m.72836 type:complete len:101 (-) Transcript_33066:1473-1775(-)|eukprot:CAMPEP_0173185188 /NCGR_PEP_ID=MMETSP1141-20130122/9404_1 /TAXON_ID=483371 /ORGANISM="non described non described, Strain CCMP2298" /LENGTH=100 /DNA_ID=CAMNT_0014108665 /DNA_START=227 /DNA_END=529 /DNA_ORIENTATION=+